VYAKLLENSTEAFLPLLMEVRRWSDRKKKVALPLFPGYVFVRIDWRDRIKVLPIDGVVRFVQIGGHPSPIPDEQIHWVRIVIGSPDHVKRVPYLAVGNEVRVTSGPFAGVRGFVQRTEGKTRVVISLQCISRAVSVEVNPACVEKVVLPGGVGDEPDEGHLMVPSTAEQIYT
jgi:transcription antitermination factor NusG